MLKNYFKIAWRGLLKGKTYSAINIIGLAAGMTVGLLIGLWIWDEVTFDHYHPNHSHIGQVLLKQELTQGTIVGDAIALPMEDAIRTRFSGDFTRLAMGTRPDKHILSVGNKKISQEGVWAQAGLPEMLDLRMASGSLGAFEDQSTVLLSRSVATALFGDEDAAGKTILVDDKTPLKVVGVYEDLPANTSFFRIKYFLPWNNTPGWWQFKKTDWTNHLCQLYVQIGPNADFGRLSTRIGDLPTSHINNYRETAFIHPMDQWHLYGDFKNGQIAGGRIEFIWLFGIIGIFVLILACINFMNLSTARSEKRAKEVGIRKAVGSLRGQLVGQFLSESILLAFISCLLAIALAWATLPFFNHLSGKDIRIPWGNPLFWVFNLAFVLFTGIASGSYPAFYLSRFDPVKVLKGTFSMGPSASLPRRILVVIQFTVSIALIVGTIVVFRQIQFAKNRPVGYSREGLITLPMSSDTLYHNYNGLRRDMLGTGAIQDMAESNASPTEVNWSNTGFEWQGKDPKWQPLFGTIAVTYDFGKTVGWKIVQGRDFSRDYNDSFNLIMNESAVKLSGIKDPVGKTIDWLGKTRHVVGVVEDMVMTSPYKPVVPTIFHVQYDWVTMIVVRIKPAEPLRDALARIEPVFKRYSGGNPFEYRFVDEEYARKFSDEERIGNLSTFFAVLAIFISCLGLFGLASYIAERRTKEISVRKVLGASVFNLWKMLSLEFLLLVIISCAIAIPIAWYYLEQWLKNYEYRTQIPWWAFAAAAVGAIAITILTVSYQAIKAATNSPVKGLRSE